MLLTVFLAAELNPFYLKVRANVLIFLVPLALGSIVMDVF